MSTWHFWNHFEEYLEMQYILFYSYFGQNLFFISLYNRYYQFLWQSPASENYIPWKEKKYILKQPQNINRSVCIMKCALESTSTKHCSFISATPVHTFTDADLPEPCTDPHNQQTTVQKWSVLGFVSHEKEAKHCKTYWVNSSTKSFGQTLKKYCWSYHFAK